ncbi:cell division septum initiation protein DivIVA [Saccharopolyspora lacisalsi]|uniref:Cell division septum initiation protein DivIVA n=1 Tax=Halosaccharopolyspora lacisalsi TaxID=1000566 RepID=A0A839DWZ6_9PSEU|nr:hypothetical protein [Halosaccharopolyspora lacisalsi]MBA8825269.1 cell division septum initiation protein DivIVA [Halosaccharopolyspora lacisalsi]
MNDESVVPLRPGFDNEFRGFNRNQVIEHIELLEDQITMLTTDRDEAVRINEDQRRITDETRHQLEETVAELKRLEDSETGLPQATRRMQNMLMMADEEANTIREHARRDAETIRGTASTDAEHMRREAEATATALREECAGLVADLENKRERIDSDHASQTAEIEAKREEMHRSIQAEYNDVMSQAQSDATEMLRQTRQRCEELETESQRYHARIVDDLDGRAAKLESFRQLILETLDSMSGFASMYRSSVTQQSAVAAPQEWPALTEHPNAAADELRRHGQDGAVAIAHGENGPAGHAGPVGPVGPVGHEDNERRRISPITDEDVLGEEVPLASESKQPASAVGHPVHSSTQGS